MDTLTHPAIAEVSQSCASYPEQWEGTFTDGRAFYFRYRFARASLATGPDRSIDGISRPWQATGDQQCAFIAHGDDPMDGAFSDDAERSEVFGRLFDLVAVNA